MVSYTIIVPAYNSAQTLPACLKALANQSVPESEYEIIVIDDGSVDNTKEIVQGFKVNYFFQENKGPAYARNRGAQLAKGEIILFTDADCEPVFDWVEEMIRPFNDPQIVAVKGVYKTRQRGLGPRFAQAEFEDRYDLLKKHPYIDMIDTHSAAYRREIFLKMNGFDEAFPVANNEDTDLSYRLASSGHKMVFAPNAIVYHKHPSTLLKYLKTKFWRGYWRIVVYRRYPKKAFKDTYTPHVLKFQTMLMAISLLFIPLSILSSKLLYLTLLFWAVIIALSFPFSEKTFKRDKMLGVLSPALIFLRSIVFALGSLYGVIGCMQGMRNTRNKSRNRPTKPDFR